MKKMGFAAVVAFTLSSLAWAQEKPAQRPSKDPVTTPDEQEEQEEAQPETRKHIQVLQNPYDISSFYRSSQGSSYGSSFGSAPVDPRYPIAGFYRSRQSRPSPLMAPMIWNDAFGPGLRGQQLPGRTFLRRGELFLFAPTFLAPFGPFMDHRGR